MIKPTGLRDLILGRKFDFDFQAGSQATYAKPDGTRKGRKIREGEGDFVRVHKIRQLRTVDEGPVATAIEAASAEERENLQREEACLGSGIHFGFRLSAFSMRC